jgi:hypothetical protein
MPSIRFHHDAALKQKFVIHATECGNRDEWRKFTITEANALRWGNDHASMFLCKATTISHRAKERKTSWCCSLPFRQRDARKKGAYHRQAMQVKAAETAKSLGITNFKSWVRLVRQIYAPWETVTQTSNINLVKYTILFSWESDKLSAIHE